jgi:hypothetical protein
MVGSLPRAALTSFLSFLLAAPAPLATPAPAQNAPAPPVSIAHDDVACVVAGQYPRLEACVAPPERIGRAQVQFRANETGLWYAVDLAPGQQCLAGVLPKPLRTTRSIEYFVDVIDRSFNEARRPERAPDVPYRARVVAQESDCHELGRMAAWMPRPAGPILVSAVRDSSGRALDAAAARAAGAQPPPGFSPEGVVAASPQGAGDAAPKSGGSAAAAASAGGIGLGTIGLVAGGAVLAGVAVAAAAGGGGDGNAGNGGSGSSATPLNGTWVGTSNRTITTSGILVSTCTEEVTLDSRQSGAALTGTITVATTTCTLTAAPGLPPITTTSPGGSAPVTGTVSGSAVQFTFGQTASCAPIEFTGTVSGDTLAGTFRQACPPVSDIGNWTARRR